MGTLNSSASENFHQNQNVYVVNPLKNVQYPEGITKVQQFPINQILSKKSCKVIINKKNIPQYFHYIRLFHHKIYILDNQQQDKQKINFCFDFIKRIKISADQLKILSNPIQEQQNKLKCNQTCDRLPFPVALILSRLQSDILRKILNLFQFYQINVIKYPSMQIFVASKCCTKKIVCGVSELEELSKIANNDYFPHNETQINVYCYCKQDQDKDLIHIPKKLKQKKVNVKFSFNMIKLVHEILLDKELKSEQIKQVKQLKSGETLNVPSQSITKTRNLIKVRPSINHSMISSSLKVQQKKQKKHQSVLFYIDQKQKDSYSIRSLTQKIFRIVGTMKIKQVHSIDSLLEKVKQMISAIVIVSQTYKIYIDLCEKLQIHGLQEKVILVKRSQNDTADDLAKKIIKIRDRGLYRYQNLKVMNYLKKSIIVFGSKVFLQHIFECYPFLNVKLFVDISIFKQHHRVREIISRKNQLIVTSMRICNCMENYKGLIHSQIVYYDFSSENQISFLNLNRKNSCSCSCANSEQNIGIKKSLTQLLQEKSVSIINFNYYKNKMTVISREIQILFSKMKQKKFILNVAQNQYDEILFVHPENYTIQKLLTFVLKALNNRYINSWLSLTSKKSIISQCFHEINTAINIQFDSVVTLKSEQLSDIYQLQYKQIFQIITNFTGNQELFILAEILIKLVAKNSLFRRCVNFLWKNFIGINKHQYCQPTPVIFFFLFISYRKSSIFNRKKNSEQVKSRKVITKKIIALTNDIQTDEAQPKRVYLRVLNFQKSEEQNLIKFFTGKANTMSFIYTTQFLVCEQISQNQIQKIGLKEVLQKEKEKIIKNNLFNQNKKLYQTDSNPFLRGSTRRNTEQIYSTQNSIIICVQNCDVLAFDLYQPFLKDEQTKKYVIAPFTKFIVSKQFNSLTHQLKVSLTHQQKFLQKILQYFIVDKNLSQRQIDLVEEYYQEEEKQLTEQKQKEQQQQKSKDSAQMSKSPKNFSKMFRQENSKFKIINEDFRIPKSDLFLICMSQCKYFTAHYLLTANISKSYLSNAYKVLILTRKGLYTQAQKTLWKTNPYCKSLSSYIFQLRKRSYNQVVNERSQNQQRKLSKVKWQLNYNYNEQKFYLTDKGNQLKKCCFNQDSLNTIYYETIKQSTQIRTNQAKQSTLIVQNKQKEFIFLQTFPHQRKYNKSNFNSQISSVYQRSALNITKQSQQSLLAQMKFYQSKETSQFLVLDDGNNKSQSSSESSIQQQSPQKNKTQLAINELFEGRSTLKMRSSGSKNGQKVQVRMRDQSIFLRREQQRRRTQIIHEQNKQNVDLGYFDQSVSSTDSIIEVQEHIQLQQKGALFQQFESLQVKNLTERQQNAQFIQNNYKMVIQTQNGSFLQNFQKQDQEKVMQQDNINGQNIRKSVYILDLSSDSSLNSEQEEQYIVVKQKGQDQINQINEDEDIQLFQGLRESLSLQFFSPKIKIKKDYQTKSKIEFLNVDKQQVQPRQSQRSKKMAQFTFMKKQTQNNLIQPSNKTIITETIGQLESQGQKYVRKIHKKVSIFQPKNFKGTNSIRINQQSQHEQVKQNITKTLFEGMLNSKCSDKNKFSIVVNCSQRKLQKDKNKHIQSIDGQTIAQSHPYERLLQNQSVVSIDMDYLTPLKGGSICKTGKSSQRCNKPPLRQNRVIQHEKVSPIDEYESQYERMSSVNKSLTNLRLNMDLRRKR